MDRSTYTRVSTVELHAVEVKSTLALPSSHVPKVELACDRLFFKMPHSQHADEFLLQNVSFEAKAGQVTAILGSSGSGKTTLLECLMARLPFETPADAFGALWYQDAGHEKYKECRFAFVEQQVSLLGCLTVQETLQFAADL